MLQDAVLFQTAISAEPVFSLNAICPLDQFLSVCLCSVFKMSALNSNNTVDGLDEPVKPTPGVEKQTGQRKSPKTTKKEGSSLRWRVNTHCGMSL